MFFTSSSLKRPLVNESSMEKHTKSRDNSFKKKKKGNNPGKAKKR